MDSTAGLALPAVDFQGKNWGSSHFLCSQPAWASDCRSCWEGQRGALAGRPSTRLGPSAEA